MRPMDTQLAMQACYRHVAWPATWNWYTCKKTLVSPIQDRLFENKSEDEVFAVDARWPALAVAEGPCAHEDAKFRFWKG
jgi:hypothetical protein